jgi:hypothetical protein
MIENLNYARNQTPIFLKGAEVLAPTFRADTPYIKGEVVEYRAGEAYPSGVKFEGEDEIHFYTTNGYSQELPLWSQTTPYLESPIDTPQSIASEYRPMFDLLLEKFDNLHKALQEGLVEYRKEELEIF